MAQLAVVALVALTAAITASAAFARDLSARTSLTRPRRIVEIKFRPVLAELPADGSNTSVAAEAVKSAIARCDPFPLMASLAAGEAVPSTPPDQQSDTTCAVLELLLSGDQKGHPRLFVGPVKLDGRDLKGAQARANDPVRTAKRNRYTVDITLTRSGRRALNRLAAAVASLPPPQNQVAITLSDSVRTQGGEVVLVSPTFRDRKFTTNDLEISGSAPDGFSRSEAQLIAAAIETAAKKNR